MDIISYICSLKEDTPQRRLKLKRNLDFSLSSLTIKKNAIFGTLQGELKHDFVTCFHHQPLSLIYICSLPLPMTLELKDSVQLNDGTLGEF